MIWRMYTREGNNKIVSIIWNPIFSIPHLERDNILNFYVHLVIEVATVFGCVCSFYLLMTFYMGIFAFLNACCDDFEHGFRSIRDYIQKSNTITGQQIRQMLIENIRFFLDIFEYKLYKLI